MIALPLKYVVHFSHSLPSEKKSVNTTFVRPSVDHRLNRLSDIHDILYERSVLQVVDPVRVD